MADKKSRGMFDLIGLVSNLFCVELIATKECKALLEKVKPAIISS